MLKPGDHQRIADAIAAAEAKTSGEIFCIVTAEVSKYREIPIAWGAAAALIVPPAAVFVGLHPWTLMLDGSGWSQAPNLGDAVTQSLTAYAIVQAIIFAVVAFFVALPPVRRLATPRFLKRHPRPANRVRSLRLDRTVPGRLTNRRPDLCIIGRPPG